MCGLSLIELANELGLARFQVERALAAGLIPPADCTTWPEETVADLLSRISEIRERVGSVPDLGANLAAEVLTERLGVMVPFEAIAELADRGVLPVVSTGHGFPLYCGRTLEALSKSVVLDAAAAGRLLTVQEATEWLGIRLSDFQRLVHGKVVLPAPGRSRHWRGHLRPGTALYRLADLENALAREDLDWQAARRANHGDPAVFDHLPPRPR